MKLLVIDDNTRFTSSLYVLFKNSYTVHIANAAQAALQKIKEHTYDMILLDLSLPDQHGQALYQTIRQHTEDTPVIVVSGEQNPRLKVQLLQSGVSDFIPKPVFADELRTRVMMHIHRPKLSRPTGLIYTHDLIVNTLEQSTSRNGRFIFLRRREFDLLQCLASNIGEMVTKEQLAQAIWNESYASAKNNLHVHMSMLRKKLDTIGSEPLIQTQHGVGYCLRLLPKVKVKGGKI